MIVTGILLGVVSAILLCVAGLLHVQNRISFRRLRVVHSRRANDIQRRRMERMELRNRKILMEDTVRGGTTAVEAIHRTITGTTFDLVDRYSRSEELKAKAKKAREVHDEKSRTFYKAVRTTNRALHVFADMIAERQSPSKPGKDQSSDEK